MEDGWKDIVLKVVVGGIMLIVGLAVAGFATYAQAYQKAEAYRRVTGKTISVQDAIWLDLRIQEPAK